MIEHFRIAMINAGIEAPNILADGKIHRFHLEGDKLKTQNGWYIFFDDGLPIGRFGCWKRGISEKWCGSKSNSTLTYEQKKLFSKRMAAIKQQREDEQRQIHSDCRDKCMAIWQEAKAANSDHPYLKKKNINAHGVKTFNGSLIVPVQDIADNIRGIQFISPSGIKRFKTGTEKHGHFFKIGSSHERVILICEGFATGASIHEATGHTVTVAFDASNLKPVAEILRRVYPKIKIIICSDNDAWHKKTHENGEIIYHVVKPEENTGVSKALDAARTVSGLITIPQFKNTSSKPTDFNDLQLLEGLETIKQQVEAANYVPQ